MTDKMSKEEALSALNEFLSSTHLATVKADVIKIVESIEPEHKKVVLPKAVGEQWDRLVANKPSNNNGNSVDYALSDLANDVNDSADFPQLSDWWGSTPDSYRKLIDASRYGWVPEKEKLWNVFVPKAIKIPGHVSIYAKFKHGVQPVNTDGPISAGEYTFTEEELIKYGLDGDLFEKEPVKDTK